MNEPTKAFKPPARMILLPDDQQSPSLRSFF